MRSYLIVLTVALFGLAHSSPVYDDPCLHAKCDSGEICIQSLDGYSYNCVKEKKYSTHIKYDAPVKVKLASKERDLFTNKPVNYFEKYMSYNPCLSSPCGMREVCRVISKTKYVCQKELEMYADTKSVKEISQRKMKQDIYENLRNIFRNHKKNRNFKLLKATNLKLKDEDYVELSNDDIKTRLSDVCLNQKHGSKIVNPIRMTQYIICLTDSYIIRNCQRGYVFNKHSDKCEKTQDIPLDILLKENPCLNDSTFTQITKYQYRCDCPPGFTGKHCEKSDICEASFCGKEGVCLSIGFESKVSHMCWCNNGINIGMDCDDEDTLEINPCLSLEPSRIFHRLENTPSVYVECGEENKPLLHRCEYPLIFSQELQECNWEPNEMI